jgi:hypothetical protein
MRARRACLKPFLYSVRSMRNDDRSRSIVSPSSEPAPVCVRARARVCVRVFV